MVGSADPAAQHQVRVGVPARAPRGEAPLGVRAQAHVGAGGGGVSVALGRERLALLGWLGGGLLVGAVLRAQWSERRAAPRVIQENP